MARDYAAGMRTPDIAAKHECSLSTVRAAVNRYGVKARKPGRPPNASPRPTPAPVSVRPKCCKRWTVPIEDAATGEVRSYTCMKCWKEWA